MTAESIGLLKDILIVPAILAVGYLWKTTIHKKDVAEKEITAQWHSNVDAQFDAVIKKITGYCQTNSIEHEQLYTTRNNHSERLADIEAVHRVKGCDRRSIG